MHPLIAALLLLSPEPAAREPVGRGAWREHSNPVVQRISSLLAGLPRRCGFVSVVPLFARAPAEAGHDRTDGPVWIHASNTGKVLRDAGRTYLRIANPGVHPLLVPSGAVYLGAKEELAVTRGAIVGADFTALLPAKKNTRGARVPGAGRFVGVLPPDLTGLVLHAGSDLKTWTSRRWRHTLRTGWYTEACRERSVRSLLAGLELTCHSLATAFGRTAVGAVFLIGGRPVAAHAFSTNDLFVQSMSDLLLGLAIQARQEQYGFSMAPAIVDAQLTRRAEVADERARALAYLRRSFAVKSIWRESSGEGHEMLLHDVGSRTVGHAVLDRQRTVAHFGLYALGPLWPGATAAAPGAPKGPSSPGDGPGGTSPAAIDRKQRPSIAEERQRERKPRATGHDGGTDTAGGDRGR